MKKIDENYQPPEGFVLDNDPEQELIDQKAIQDQIIKDALDKKNEKELDYKPEEGNSDFEEALTDLRDNSMINRLLFEGYIDGTYPIFEGKMKVHLRTLSIGEKIKVALSTEQVGSVLGQESYGLVSIVETLARAIIDVDGEKIYKTLDDEDKLTNHEIYERQRIKLLQWSSKTINEIFKSAWEPILAKENEYIETLKKG